jgi:hypothetical protein
VVIDGEVKMQDEWCSPLAMRSSVAGESQTHRLSLMQ